ncbi:unnamed protein product [Paramecium pentaurelia]|uniref:Uncharacterized protein n=1 Tax=Paramecium pentaurelia TaxID=43138 RepID=A0A8S1XV31_9CILI|nr:unnamed protein product [Paramecium pentaurelia]
MFASSTPRVTTQRTITFIQYFYNAYLFIAIDLLGVMLQVIW